jgi:flagellar protein FliS
MSPLDRDKEMAAAADRNSRSRNSDMPWRPETAYLEAEVLTADSTKLVQILYDLGIDSIQNARECLRQHDILGRGRSVNKAFEVLVELMNSLNTEQGGEIAANYARLYDYCQRRLLEGHAQKSEPALAEVQSLLEDLREAWQAVVVSQSPTLALHDAAAGSTCDPAALDAEPRYSCVG